jgi:hypothetical protein
LDLPSEPLFLNSLSRYLGSDLLNSLSFYVTVPWLGRQPTFSLGYWHNQLLSWISQLMGPHSQTAPVFTLALASLAASASAAMALCSCTGSLTSFLKKKIYNKYPFNRVFYSITVLTKGVKMHVTMVIRKRPKMQQNKPPNKSAFLNAPLL